MTVREYIGSRYVPLFIGEWDINAEYEPLSIVSYQGNSYTSRQAVPADIEITNTAYWAITGNYNAQVEQYRQETAQVAQNLNSLDAEVEQFKQETAQNFDSLDAEIDQYTKIVNDIDALVNYTFETVADMSASEKLKAGRICKTLGFHEKGDGGSAYYEIGNTGVINGINVIGCQDDLLAVFINTSDGIHVKQYGAYGDASHDDTAAIKKAVDDANLVYIDEGFYHTTETIVLPDNTRISGINAVPYSCNFVNTFETGTFQFGNNCSIGGVNCNTNGQESNINGYFLYGNNASHIDIRECGLTGSTYNQTEDKFLKLTGSWVNLQMYRCIVDSGSYSDASVHLEHSTSDTRDPDIIIKECFIDNWNIDGSTTGSLLFKNIKVATLVNNMLRVTVGRPVIYITTDGNFESEIRSFYSNFIGNIIVSNTNCTFRSEYDTLDWGSFYQFNGKAKFMRPENFRTLNKEKYSNLTNFDYTGQYKKFNEPDCNNWLFSSNNGNLVGFVNDFVIPNNTRALAFMRPQLVEYNGISVGVIIGNSITNCHFLCYERDNNAWYVKLYKPTAQNDLGTAIATYGPTTLPDEIVFTIFRDAASKLNFCVGEIAMQVAEVEVSNLIGIGCGIFNASSSANQGVIYEGYQNF